MQVHIDTEINAPAHEVWAVIGQEFASVADWASIVDESRPLDLDEIPSSMPVAVDAPVPGRQMKSKAGTFKEVLVEYSDAERQFTFDTADLPRIMRTAKNHTRVAETGPGTSTVSFDITLEPAGPMKPVLPLLKRRMLKSWTSVQHDLKTHVEAGL